MKLFPRLWKLRLSVELSVVEPVARLAKGKSGEYPIYPAIDTDGEPVTEHKQLKAVAS